MSIFQNVAKSSTGESASYFGIKGLATGKEDPQSYLDEAKVRSLLADPAEHSLQSPGQLDLREKSSCVRGWRVCGAILSWFGCRGLDSAYGGFIGPAALANGCYWFTTQYGACILDGRGQELVKKKFYDHLITDVTLSDFTPALTAISTNFEATGLIKKPASTVSAPSPRSNSITTGQVEASTTTT